MVERNRVGLIFSYNENWIAGAYYILNIIHALNSIEDKKKPILIIFTESLENYRMIQEETAYPYLEYFNYPQSKPQYSILERLINKISRLIFKRNSIVKQHNLIPNLDFLYPKEISLYSNKLKRVNWMPDFQEDYLPHLFSEDEVEKRKRHQREIVAKGDIVVLSSEDAKSDFLRLYPKAKAEPFVLPFAVTHPDFSMESLEHLLMKYDLPKNYFFAPNQFWAHKNHIVILKAVKELIANGQSITVAMSGKENDYRNKDNFEQLKNYISTNNLEENIRFLGFMPRTEQLCLFKHAQAIIQPSLFEGWSTVVEDAKSLDKFIIASNLNVHTEQIKENVSFFNPTDEFELARCIQQYISNSPKILALNYNSSIFEFGTKFYELTQLAIEKKS